MNGISVYVYGNHGGRSTIKPVDKMDLPYVQSTLYGVSGYIRNVINAKITKSARITHTPWFNLEAWAYVRAV